MEAVVSYISLITAFVSLAISVITHLKTVKHDQRRDTLDAYNVLQKQALDTLNRYTKKEILSAVEENDKGKLGELSGYLARIEHFSVGVNTKIYDSKTVYELAHGYLDKAVWFKLQPLIDAKEKTEIFYGNYRKLVDEMNKIETKERTTNNCQENSNK